MDEPIPPPVVGVRAGRYSCQFCPNPEIYSDFSISIMPFKGYGAMIDSKAK
jgi:hypothetical protein